MTSVSVVDWKIEPRRLSSPRSCIALEILPLWATAKPPVASSANKRLDVAQGRSRRSSNSGHGRSRPRARRARGSTSSLSKLPATWPIARWLWKARPSKLVMPAASWPRCWSACRPSATMAAASCAPIAEHAAFLAQLVGANIQRGRINEWLGDVHGSLEGSAAARSQWRLGRNITRMLRWKLVGDRGVGGRRLPRFACDPGFNPALRYRS